MAAVPARAAEIGAASMLGIQLWVEGDNLAALNLYSRRVDTFDDESEQIGLLFASHAAVAFASVQDMNHMRTALATRDLIGQAKGILMERYQVTGDQAFQMLVKVSNDNNLALRSVAENLASTGTLSRRYYPAAVGLPDPGRAAALTSVTGEVQDGRFLGSITPMTACRFGVRLWYRTHPSRRH